MVLSERRSRDLVGFLSKLVNLRVGEEDVIGRR